MKACFLFQIVVSCCLFVIWGCRNSPAPITETEHIEEDTIRKLSMLFVGDVMGHLPQIKSALNPNTGLYDYNPCFSYVKPIIEKADFAVANLEVTLPGNPPYQGYPHFRSPDALAKALKNAGFDMLVTANNHSNDAGKLGVIHTLDVAKDNNFLYTGTFRNQKEKDENYPLIVKKDSFKLAFLNYTYGTNGMRDIPPTLVNMMDTSLMKKDLRKAKMSSPDATIVLIHWGKEYNLYATKKQKRIANQLFDWGADIIIGSHPHVIEPIDRRTLILPDSSKKEVFITYSLGNFISNQRKENTDGGLIVNLDLVKNLKTNKVTIGDTKYSFVWRYIYNKKESNPAKRTYYSVPISAFESDSLNKLQMTVEDQKAMKAFATKFRAHLKENANIKERKYTFDDLYTENWIAPNAWMKAEKKENASLSIKTKPDKVYKVQWQESKQKLSMEAPINTPTEVKKVGDWYQYLLGNESDNTGAEQLLKRVKERGFPMAYTRAIGLEAEAQSK